MTYINAPFTEPEVEALHAWQRSGNFHPFTCANGHTLRATVKGWICPREECADFSQDWAYDFMIDRDALGRIRIPPRWEAAVYGS